MKEETIKKLKEQFYKSAGDVTLTAMNPELNWEERTKKMEASFQIFAGFINENFIEK